MKRNSRSKKKKKSGGGSIWGSLTRLVGGGGGDADEGNDSEDEREAAREAEARAQRAKVAAAGAQDEAAAFAASMRTIAWIPTLRTRLHPCMPWPRGDAQERSFRGAGSSGAHHSGGDELASDDSGRESPRRWLRTPQALVECKYAALVLPSAARPSEEAWQCSALYGVLDAPTPASSVLRSALGWATPLPAAALATQLARLGSAWRARSDAAGADGADGADGTAAAETDAAGAPPDAAEDAAAALSWQRATAAAVPLLYGALSAARIVGSARALESAASVLRGSPWVWVGDAFVPPERVAFSGGATADATPFVYVAPVELASYAPLLRRLGVRDAFGATDYAVVLRLMHVRAAGAPLSVRWLQIAIAMVQALSDGASTADISDWELFVPDAEARLCAASALVFDDAPWLSAASPALSALAEPPRLVHHKLSAAVAERLGVRSLRLSLLATSASSLSLSLNPQAALQGEAFGQAEPLTRRLRHILELYAEGPGVLNELIQNADDAGATTVKIVYSSHRYKSKSLLGPRLAEWQGPALYVYNDATFTESDFVNLSRIGQGSKLSRLETTGRFGLGFNAGVCVAAPVYSLLIFCFLFPVSSSFLFCGLVSFSHLLYSPFSSPPSRSVPLHRRSVLRHGQLGRYV